MAWLPARPLMAASTAWPVVASRMWLPSMLRVNVPSYSEPPTIR
ncbi:MAG: hypothetical protein ACYC61_11025 [Isosphaeraceae bacterium]